jgi:alkane 1-monooxygenase
MGAMGSVLAINSAHEIGHRTTPLNKLLSKLLLTSVLYVHFFEEHNFGHHRNVGTYNDPATARKGEWLYVFVIRSVVFGWIGAWKIEQKRLTRNGGSAFSLKNEVLVWQLLQLGVIVLVYYFLGHLVLGCFALASFFSIFLLEAINYIEHYGLTREKVSEFRYEKVNPTHSWNADNQIGRAVLFELTRHSDHHENPSKPYQILESPGNTPQLPTGYPGMILISLIPPLFFSMMHKRMN